MTCLARRWRPPVVGALSLACALLSSPSAAVAEQQAEGGEPPEPLLSPWQSDEDTWFVSGTTDAGIIYLRPRVMLGYGSPHWKFVALDAYVTVTNSFTSPYAGWRATFPFLDVFLGARTVYPYNRRVLAPRDSHRGKDLDLESGDERSTYNAVDFEIAALAPVLHGIAYTQVHTVVVDAPRDAHIFEERIRAVMAPPMAVLLRAGYLYGVGARRALQGGRHQRIRRRAEPSQKRRSSGPILIARVFDEMSAVAVFSHVIDSPDELGILHGTYAFVGIDHRWAVRF